MRKIPARGVCQSGLWVGLVFGWLVCVDLQHGPVVISHPCRFAVIFLPEKHRVDKPPTIGPSWMRLLKMRARACAGEHIPAECHGVQHGAGRVRDAC